MVEKTSHFSSNFVKRVFQSQSKNNDVDNWWKSQSLSLYTDEERLLKKRSYHPKNTHSSTYFPIPLSLFLCVLLACGLAWCESGPWPNCLGEMVSTSVLILQRGATTVYSRKVPGRSIGAACAASRWPTSGTTSTDTRPCAAFARFARHRTVEGTPSRRTFAANIHLSAKREEVVQNIRQLIS